MWDVDKRTWFAWGDHRCRRRADRPVPIANPVWNSLRGSGFFSAYPKGRFSRSGVESTSTLLCQCQSNKLSEVVLLVSDELSKPNLDNPYCIKREEIVKSIP